MQPWQQKLLWNIANKKLGRLQTLQFLSLSKNLFFGRLAEVTKAGKTSNSPPKCMWILERGELRSKSKSLA